MGRLCRGYQETGMESRTRTRLEIINACSLTKTGEHKQHPVFSRSPLLAPLLAPARIASILAVVLLVRRWSSPRSTDIDSDVLLQVHIASQIDQVYSIYLILYPDCLLLCFCFLPRRFSPIDGALHLYIFFIFFLLYDSSLLHNITDLFNLFVGIRSHWSNYIQC